MAETGSPPESTPSQESAALDSLKTQLTESNYPAFARAFGAHLKTYPQEPEQLAEKLGRSRTWGIQMFGISKLPEDILVKAQTDGAGFRDLRELYTASQPGSNEYNGGNKTGNSGNNEGNSGNSQKVTGNIPGNSGNNEYNSGNSSGNRLVGTYPLLRDTINAFARVVFFWVKEPELGEVAERWVIRIGQTGWVWTGLQFVWFGLALYGGWTLQQRIVPEVRGLWRGMTTSNIRGPSSQNNPALGILGTALTTPRVTGTRWVSGHRMELRWTSMGTNWRYRVYWNSPNGNMIRPLVQTDVKTPGAIVSANFLEGRALLSVTSIAPNDEESAHSQLVEFVPTAVNQGDSVEPLAMSGAAIPQTASVNTASPPTPLPMGEGRRQKSPLPSGEGGPSAKRMGGEAPTPPAEVHAEVKTPDLIRISWRAVGPGLRYNVYSSTARELTILRKENDHPLQSNTVDWTPETGKERYWMVVTTLDSQGHESAYSEAIEVVRHPEKSDDGSLDGVAGVLRKVLPW